MTEPGLEKWDEPFPEVPILRRPHSPVEVVVDISRALPGGAGLTRADGLPLRVRAGGIHLESLMHATLHSWIRVCDGRWIAQICLPVRTAGDRTGADLWLWVDSSFVSPVGESGDTARA